METIYDVLRHLVKLLGAGEVHDRAMEVIDTADPAKPAAPAGAEGTDQP